MARTSSKNKNILVNDRLAIGYCRVSTREQADEGVSLAAQQDKIESFANSKDLDLVECIVEEGVSGSVPLKERDGGSLIFEAIQNRGVRVVIATKLDRLFRDALDCLAMTREWEKLGVKVLLLDMGVDFSTPTGKAFLTNAASFAELERNLISERTKDGLAQVKKEGIKLGGVGWGWTRVDVLDEKGRFNQAVVTEEIEIVIRIKKMREGGCTFQHICDVLDSEGIKTKKGGKWWPMTVKNICNLEIDDFKNLKMISEK
jgi:site-specific DNA recombinase